MVNIPVLLDGDLFDLDTLIGLKKDAQGYRAHPLNGDKFLLSNLQPAKNVQRKIEKMIENEIENAPAIKQRLKK